MVNGEVQGTRNPTGHMILLDLHFEVPFEGEVVEGDQSNMVYNNYGNDQEYIENCADYQDYDYQNQSFYGPQNAPISSLETSRQNSYERDERKFYDNNYYNNQFQQYENGVMRDDEYDDGALYYNSRPKK